MQHIIQQSKSFFQYPWLETIVWAAGLLVAAFMINYLIRHLLLRGSYRLLALIDHGEHADIRRTIRHLANIAPALVFLFGIRLIPAIPAKVSTVIQNVSKAFIIFTIALALIALLNFIHMLYRLRPEAKSMSIKGMIQIAEIVIFAVATILVLSTLIDQSPFVLLSGLGAMAAVLILVFQDTLLSFVAGIQISSTDMIRVGDWIEVSNLGADGDVIDIALHTVKVQNFDKTITTVPIRKFVTDPFKNWRGMQESGGRRIKRALYIDQSSIGFLNEKDIKRLSHHRQLKTYMQEKQKEIAEWNSRLDIHETITADIRKLTNIGTFRAYVFAYIKNHTGIHQKMTILVRQTAPGPEGLPLEIYCFTNTVNWHEYEAIQSDIFDHLYSILPSFGLRVFQSPGAHDMQLILSAMKTSKIILKTENQPGD